MSQTPRGTYRRNDLTYRTESEPAVLLGHLSEIQALADCEKEALGFLPSAAYREAIEKQRLIAMLAETEVNVSVVGFVLFSGVFPYARIQQVVVRPEHRRKRLASALINGLAGQLEARGYISISAAVASDLPTAQTFYEATGFSERRAKQGGQARNRTIILRARDLETENLFSVLETPASVAPTATDLGLRLRSAGPAPLYVIDLNVLFDVLRDRHRFRSAAARRLITAALAHQVRFAVAAEFVVELERTTKGASDPVLHLAKQLPRLPTVDYGQVDQLAATIHRIVFVDPGSSQAGTPQALSDARHLSEAALGGASGYVTSDGRMLAVRDELLRQIGIDVASLDEFDALLPTALEASSDTQLHGTDCVIKGASVEIVRSYLDTHRAPVSVLSEFAPAPSAPGAWAAYSVSEGRQVVGIGVKIVPVSIDAPVRMLVHMRPDHVSCNVFADYLLDMQSREACAAGPTTIQLLSLPGQSAVRRAAVLRGLFQSRVLTP